MVLFSYWEDEISYQCWLEDDSFPIGFRPFFRGYSLVSQRVFELNTPLDHQEFQIPKMEVLNLTFGYFGGWENSLT